MALDLKPETRHLFVRWVWANTWSEALGLGGSLALGMAAVTLAPSLGDDATPASRLGVLLLAVTLGTLLEGVLVGWAQSRVLVRHLGTIAPAHWVRATALGAGVAWLLGMAPSTLMDLGGASGGEPMPEPTAAQAVALAVAMGAALGALLGGMQAWVLRAASPRWRWWIAANALAWAAAMPLVFAGMGSLPEHAGLALGLALVLSTAAGAGLLVGALHGAALVWILGSTTMAAAPCTTLRDPSPLARPR